MGVTDTLWDSSFHKVEGIFDIIKENSAVTIIAYIMTRVKLEVKGVKKSIFFSRS